MTMCETTRSWVIQAEWGDYRSAAMAELENHLRRRIANLLQARNIPGLPGLDLHVDGGCVVLHGSLPSVHAKWLCIECCRHVPGVTGVVDLTSVGATANREASGWAGQTEDEET
jgi:hypothetical protein